MNKLLQQINACRVCELYLPLGPNPVISASAQSRIVVIGQAPGKQVHNTGIPWNDKSGDNLRQWMGVDRETFYNSGKIALIPMGFCYPGRGNAGDLPPRPECAPLWHRELLDLMPEVQLTLLVGQYAQKYYLRAKAQSTLTNTVRHYQHYLPAYFPLPHPSPRNNIWQAKNPWFFEEVLPQLQARINAILTL